jgi:hypothetical protein
MFQEKLKQYVFDNPKSVSMKSAGDGIFVLKYKKSVFYNNTWNEYLEQCRGTIVDKDFNIVSRPFTKVYNYGIETRAPRLAGNTLVRAYRKVNGFMVAMTWYRDDILVSTTGSTDSPFVAMAKEMMLLHGSWKDWQLAVCATKGQTLMFECVHPNDPHIIPETAGMYFLGARENTWDSVVDGWNANWSGFSNLLNCNPVEDLVLPLDELCSKIRGVKHEGYVAYTKDGQSFKIKSPYYLTSKWVARNPRTDKLVDLKRDIKRNIDEEYHGLIDKIRDNIVEYTAMSEQERLEWVRDVLS